MSGNITRRGKSSWRLKFDLGRDSVTGERMTRFVTVRGKRQDAEKELTRLLSSAENGTLVEPTKTTVADTLRSWLDGPHGLAAKTAERYRELADRQIIPHLGNIRASKAEARARFKTGTPNCSRPAGWTVGLCPLGQSATRIGCFTARSNGH